MGDGMALVFFETPQEPVQCAMELARALKKPSTNSAVHGRIARAPRRRRSQGAQKHRGGALKVELDETAIVS